jgi:hypothetical protein
VPPAMWSAGSARPAPVPTSATLGAGSPPLIGANDQVGA